MRYLLLLVLLAGACVPPSTPTTTPDPLATYSGWSGFQTATAIAGGAVPLLPNGTPMQATTPRPYDLYALATAWAVAPTPTPETIASEPRYMTTVPSLRVRSKPSTAGAVVGGFVPTDRFTLDCSAGVVADGFAWCRVTSGDYKGNWIAAEVIGAGVVYVRQI